MSQRQLSARPRSATAATRRMRAGRTARASPCSSSSTYEEGGENNVLHGDPTSETFLSELVTAQAYENRHMTMESMYEYGSRAGVWRILREFETRELPLTIFGVGMALAAHARAARRVHGRAATRSPATACAGSTTRTCPRRPSAATSTSPRTCSSDLTGGQWPLGWYTGRDSPNTRRLVVEHGGYEYDSDYYGDDLPFWTAVTKSDGSDGAASGGAVLARRQRHALRAGAGLQHRRALLRLPARQLRRALRRGRPGRPRPAEDDVDRHALAGCSASPAGSARCSASSTTSAATTRSGCARRIDIARHWKAVHPFVPAAAPAAAGPGVA